ncbi:hypothetical protein AB1Y20_008491 [Prymnesium parvum]|uniref:Anaphase-promoting complex subunit 11 n=1 Tax=Prymnesium parvum TaxID=97485 RepID=A0AB34IRM2_PRYPA
MGIHQLQSWVDEHAVETSNLHVLSRGTRALIDGAALCFFLISTSAEARLGDYRALDAAVRRTLHNLARAGLRVTVYLDGEAVALKSFVLRGRREQRAKAAELLRAKCLDGVGVDASELHAPELMMEQFACSVAAAGVAVRQCTNESDPTIARDCHDSAEPSVILSDDSDFYLFRGVRYIRLSELRLHEDECAPRDFAFHERTPQQGTLVAMGRCWTRETLARIAGLDELTLLEWTMLMGNDYTRAFPLTSYGHAIASGLLARSSSDRPSANEVRQFLLDTHAERARLWSLREPEPALQQALVYSYRLYEHADMSDLKLQYCRRRHTELEVVGRQQMDVSSVGAAALAELADGCRGRVVVVHHFDLEEAHEEGAAHTRLGAQVEERHLVALRRLLDGERAPDALATLRGGRRSGLLRLDWEDMEVARLYERLCRRLLRAGCCDPSAPSELFDGPSFHVFATRQPICRAPCTPHEATASHPSPHDVRPLLPVDAHRADILRLGETGCGKSSRVPLFLLDQSRRHRIMVAQPRRIAAHGLYERAVHEGRAEEVGLRLGHGVRKETSATRLWYVTTGYLCTLLNHTPAAAARLSHIVLDECHERSVQTDLLCMAARRLLAALPHLRVVLMSATLHVGSLVEYFSATIGPAQVSEPLFVGARRFPLREVYLEDVALVEALPERIRSIADRLARTCAPASRLHLPACTRDVTSKQVEVAIWLVRVLASPPSVDGGGGAMLLLVPGLTEIEEVGEAFQGASRYLFVPIHSDIPFEEQLAAFEPSPAGVTKVVVATNAAESSLTLPDVDVVICFGSAKQLTYNESHRLSQLRREWISKASATQRAGRTARTRPGTVYRLYPRQLHEAFAEHNAAEIIKLPLANTLLLLKTIVAADESVTELLQEMIEAPQAANVTAGLAHLAALAMLEHRGGEADPVHLDRAPLSPLGLLAAALPVDPELTRLIARGHILGCTPEAIALAAALAQPRAPFRVANQLIHTDPSEYNQIVQVAFFGRHYFDRGMYSEPLAMVVLLAEVQQIMQDQQPTRRLSRWCTAHGLVLKYVRQLYGMFRWLSQAVAKHLAVPLSSLELSSPSFAHEPDDGSFKLILLRSLLVWSFPENQLRARPPKLKRGIRQEGGDAQRVRFGRILPAPTLAALLPPPLVYTSSSLSCDVIHVARASVVDFSTLNHLVATLLLPALEPAWAFVQGIHGEACVWVPDEKAALAREVLRQCVSDEEVLSHAARSDAGTSPSTSAHARFDLGTPTSKYQNVLKELKSRRGLARHERVASIRLMESGTGSLILSNCETLCSSEGVLSERSARLLQALFGEGAKLKVQPGQAEAHQVVDFKPSVPWAGASQTMSEPVVERRTPEVPHADAAGYLRSTSGVDRNTICLGPTATLEAALTAPTEACSAQKAQSVSHTTPAPAAASPAEDEYSPGVAYEEGGDSWPTTGGSPAAVNALFTDRPLGTRLLCTMAAGYKDRTLRVCEDVEGGDEPRIVAVPMLGTVLGLEWTYCGERALLPRQTVMKSALPEMDPVAPQELMAVAASIMQLGDSGSAGTTFAANDVTLLPPDMEWLTLVLLCGGHASDPGLLCEWQVEAAKAVAAELENQPIEPSMQIVASLRSLFDPWVSKARPPDDASDCPICCSVANERGQTPQLACQTCSNMFHASCLFSWLRFQSDLTDGFDDDVDNGSRRRCCPICRSRVT